MSDEHPPPVPQSDAPEPVPPADAQPEAVQARLPSCRRLLGYAFTLIGALLICRVAGFRDHTAVLSGTAQIDWRAYGGGFYVMIYMATVFVAPILLIAAGLVKAWGLTRTTEHSNVASADTEAPQEARDS